MLIYLYAFLVLTVLNAFKDIFAKQSMKDVDPNTLAWVTGFITAWASIPFILLNPNPIIFSPNFLLALFGWGVLYYFGKYFNFTSLSLGDISLISPLKGLITITVVFSSALLLGEYPSMLGGIGIFLVFLGTYVIGIEQKNIRPLAPIVSLWKNKAARIYLVSILCYGFTVSIDRIWVQGSSFWFWTFCMNFFVGLFSIRGIWCDRVAVLSTIRKRYMSFSSVVTLHAVVYISYAYLISQMIGPYVSSFRSAATLFTVVFGGWFFGESHLLQRFIAALIIFWWVAVITLYW